MKEQYLEELELVAMDTKKVFMYDKHTGGWFWGNRGMSLKIGWEDLRHVWKP